MSYLHGQLGHFDLKPLVSEIPQGLSIQRIFYQDIKTIASDTK